MMIVTKTPLIFIFATLLSACSSLPLSISDQFTTMHEPSSGDRARVRAIIQYGSLAGSPENSCYKKTEKTGIVIAPLISLAAKGYGGKVIEMPESKFKTKDVSASDVAEFYVAGNKPITFLQLDFGGAHTCGLSPVTFTPETGKDYEINYIHDLRARECSVLAWSLTDNKPLPLSSSGRCS